MSELTAMFEAILRAEIEWITATVVVVFVIVVLVVGWYLWR
jgi:hypothetical protein